MNGTYQRRDETRCAHSVRSEIAGWIVELEPGCWLAPWDGDPGRTLVKDCAKVFPSKKAAEDALDRASDFREWTRPALVPVRTFHNIKDQPTRRTDS